MERLQLNIRLDGQADLLEAIKEKAKSQGLSVNQFVVDALKLALGWIQDRTAIVEETLTDAKLASLINTMLDEKLTKINERLDYIDKLLDKPLDSQSETLDKLLDKSLDSQSETLDEILDKPLDSQSETLDEVLDKPLDSQSNKDHLWVICKVDKLDYDRFSCWTGSFKQGFTTDLSKAQTYQEKSLNRIANKIANSEHAADTSKESILCKTLWDLKRMTTATAPQPMPN